MISLGKVNSTVMDGCGRERGEEGYGKECSERQLKWGTFEGWYGSLMQQKPPKIYKYMKRI